MSVWNRHHEIGAEATIALTPVDDPSRYGVVPTDPDGKVLGFVEKPPVGEAPTNWINAGTYVLEPSVLQRIEPGRKVSIERETFPAIVADGGLWAVQSEAYWVDAGTPETYIQVQLDLLDGVRGAAVDGVAADASIDPSAVIERSVIMSGAAVAANAVIRGSIVSMDAVIGKDTLIEGSILGPRAVVGAGAKLTEMTMLGDSARVDDNASLAGAKIPENE